MGADRNMKTYSIHYQQAVNHRTFNNVENLDKHIRQVLYTFNNQLNDTDKAVLKTVWKHSLDIVGCSWMKVKTIADEVHKSVRAIGYTLTKIEHMRIIKRIPVMRKRGGNSSNIIQILPIPNLKELPENRTLQTVLADRENSQTTYGCKDVKVKNEDELRVSKYVLKQEKDIYKATLLKFAEYKINDIIEKGILVKNPSSYLMKVFKNEIRKAEAKRQFKLDKLKREPQQQKQSEPVPFYNWLHPEKTNDSKELDDLGVY
jgi:hypothetical protein